jgi:anti-anti-sigma factor
MKLVVVSNEPNYLKVALKGDIHASSVEPAEPDKLNELLGEGWPARKVLMDLGAIAMAGSAAIGWMLAINRRFKQAGGRLVIHSMRPDVAKSFKLLKVDTVLEIFPDEKGAVAAL